MIAAFWWEQPGWLIVVFAAACVLGVLWRLGRRAVKPVGGLGEGSEGGERGGSEGMGGMSRWRRGLPWIGAGVGGAAAAALGGWLLYVGTSAASVLLGVLAVVAVGWLTTRAYRRQRGSLSALSGTALVGLRLLAGALLVVVVGRPVWDWVEVDRQKPLLVVLLDQSESMAIADVGGESSGRARADFANAALRVAEGRIGRLEDIYEVRLRGVGAGLKPIEAWRVVPTAPVSSLAGAVRDAGRMRSRHGLAPLVVLLLSDGGENVEAPRALREAAAELAVGGTGLFAVGVGPAPGETPAVDLEPLMVPSRLGSRDRLRVPVSARVQGCAGSAVTVELLWNAGLAARGQVRARFGIERVDKEFEVVPPGPGLHRLTARVTLPAALGGQSFQSSAVVDVRDEGLRVLYVEGAPRTEAAFICRALQGDARLELTREFMLSGAGWGRDSAGGERIGWGDYDVVMIGQISEVRAGGVLEGLVQAVRERGVGVLLCGGRRLLNDEDCRDTALAAISAAQFVVDEFGLAGPLQFVPTDMGLRHPVLRGVGTSLVGQETTTQPADRSAWLELPPLGGAALLGEPKPLATVLARDGHGRPLLVAHEVGRGRCAVAAWESTWAWALASDEGAGLHRRLWRQLVLWLANRRPQAWVLTDEPTYALAGLASGQRRVRVRAGLSGLELTGRGAVQTAEARLELVAGEERSVVRLERQGEEWVAELPAPADSVDIAAPGEYSLEFSVRLEGGGGDEGSGVAGAEGEVLTARTRFSVAEAQLEHRPPTANLALLRSAAEKTAEQGGGYYEVGELRGLIEKLGGTDRRQEVRRRVQYRAVEREPWVLLVALTVLLGAEWAVRRRLGMA